MACFSSRSIKIKIKINFTRSLLIFAHSLIIYTIKKGEISLPWSIQNFPRRKFHTLTLSTPFSNFHSHHRIGRSLITRMEENKIKFFVPRYFRTIETRKRKRVVVLRSRFQNSNRRGPDSPSFNRVLLNGGKAAKHQTSPLKFPRKEAWSLSLSRLGLAWRW